MELPDNVIWTVRSTSRRLEIANEPPEQVGGLCYQFDDNTLWRLADTDPMTWEKVEV